MELDIKTLSFALLLTFLIQAIAFFLMTFAVRKYKGTTLWGFGELFIALGCGTIYLRCFGHFENILVMTSNFFQIGGILLFYIGSKSFFGLKQKNIPLFAAFMIYLLIIGYYTFIDYQLRTRIIVFSSAMVIISLLIVHTFINQSRNLYRESTLFVASIFLLNSLLFLFRIIYNLYNNDQILTFFSLDVMQSTTLLFSVCFGLLWTFGLIIVLNHRLRGELTESKNIFELIFNTIPDGISINSKENFQFINTNPGFTRLTGYTREEVLKSSGFLNDFWKTTNDYLRLREEFDKNGFYINQEVTFKNKNGTEKVGLLSTAQIRVKGEDCMLTIGRDISDLKQQEKELANKTHELEEMVAERDKFFSILAHDLRGPLGTALNLTELMSERSYDFSKEDYLKLADSLNKSVYSTNELLENLLEWTGVHRGIKAFAPQQTSFKELMEAFLPGLIEAADCKQISLKNDIPGETAVFADPNMAQTIFRNLINNAVKFTRNGGSIRLSVHHNDKGQTIFSVTDNGIGMNHETLKTLFRIDFKYNRQGTNGEPSSGLGLLLCKEFVERHGGEIWVESEVNKGSTFSFYLQEENLLKNL
ncbi:MAG: PAS domain-containing sensor histidine kinase [Bacteroidales bacterium]|nr:PAS domain-containing sensor histidine kinase [Bacteroidales bacterium]